MTFKEACEMFAPAPFDQEYLWLDAHLADSSDAHAILFVIVDNNGVCLCQFITVGPYAKAKEVQTSLQRNPWCMCDLDAPAYTEPDRVWHIGTVQDVIHYIKQRALR
jgi:hypothetical protein